MPPSPRRLAAGVPAYNTGPRLANAVRSLLSQRLPEGVVWSQVHVVVSGCTDDTPRVAHELTREDARVRVVEQPHREGKASALREIFTRAEGEGLVLLNGDAVAQPGAVAHLLRATDSVPAPFGAMGRPYVPIPQRGGMAAGVALMWDLHHRVHVATVGTSAGNHLSDELWLLSLPLAAPLPLGVVNDGAYIGAWLRQHGGRLIYSPEARVAISTPRSPAAHLRQRRRILWGHRQVKELLGLPPTTWTSYARRDPEGALRALLETARERPSGLPWTVFLTLIEIQAMGLAAWDRYVARADHVLWATAPSTGPADPTHAPASAHPAKPGERGSSAETS